MPRLCVLALAALALALGPAPAHAGESYYVLVFGAQRRMAEPENAHSFATFVRACDDGAGGTILEHHTISWLPETLHIRIHTLCAEPGANLPLHDTLHFVLSQGERLALWGPYRIDPWLYARSLRQADRLNSGRVRYKAVDLGYRVFNVENCIHALSTVPTPYRRLHAYIPTYGHPASRLITLRLRPHFEGDETHPWVADALGLAAYPIATKDLGPMPCLFPRMRSLMER
jgi:hypothetical protein